jgi:hypothetical protein
VKVVRAQREVGNLLKRAIVVGNEEVPLRGMKLVPEHTSLEMKGGGFAVPEKLGVVAEPLLQAARRWAK